MARPAAVTATLEDHPWFHTWYVVSDVVTDRRPGGRIAEVTRTERCEHCPTERITRIDVLVWERRGVVRYRYARGVAIVRKPKATWLHDRFLLTTPDADIRSALDGSNGNGRKGAGRSLATRSRRA